ncbi:hypothetical protein F8M41_023472 [Gigaspora margarita]|uniref:Uncharacterized protein n=1 Tax=Gigaspora margarita TaxID=4874 RepID=A0A8H4ADD7_GIGMA|nr:hypothetical protein F8M41_023472 [Gigaspora margarita]
MEFDADSYPSFEYYPLPPLFKDNLGIEYDLDIEYDLGVEDDFGIENNFDDNLDNKDDLSVESQQYGFEPSTVTNIHNENNTKIVTDTHK